MSSLSRLDTGVNPVVDTKINAASQRVPIRTQWFLFTTFLVVSDLFMTGLAFLLAYYVRFELNIPVFNLEVTPSFDFYTRLMLIMLPFWIGLYWVRGLYDRKNLLGGTKEYSLVFNTTTMGLFLMIATRFLFSDDLIFARGWLVISWVFVFFFTSLSRFLLRRLVYFLRRFGYFLAPAIIVGANAEGISLAEQLMSWETSGFHVIGFVDKKLKPGAKVYRHLNCLGKVDELEAIIDQHQVREIILATSAISSRDKMLDIFKEYGVKNDVNVRFSSGLYEIITTGLTVNQFAFVPLVGVNKVRLTGVDMVLKFILDYVLTIPALIVISPILLLIAIAVKLDSPGPVIHRRRVVGVNGKEFDAFKFRTMRVNGDEILEQYPELKAELAREHKLKNDPRVTKLGAFLRKFSIDEIPQLVNVLRREMSLVGPRMITKAELDMYDKWDTNLQTIPPGITGLWQVSGRSDISYDERVRLDMQYIRNWTIWLDLQLILQTFPAVLKGSGAY